MPETVKTLDTGLKIYMERDLASQIIAELTEGVEVKLGACTISEGREWLEATVGDAVGYVLAPSARGHTTLRPPDPSLKESASSLPLSTKPSAQSAPQATQHTYVCPKCNSFVTTPSKRGALLNCPKGHRVYLSEPVGLRGILIGAAVSGVIYLLTYFAPYLLEHVLVVWAALCLRCLFAAATLYTSVLKGLAYARRPDPARRLGMQMLQRGLGFVLGFSLAAPLAVALRPPESWAVDLPGVFRVFLQTARTHQVSVGTQQASVNAERLGYWVDPATRLMWTLKDNGTEITQPNAASYCNALTTGGFRDWRLPSIAELAGIYQSGALPNNAKGGIQVSGPYGYLMVWSDTEEGSGDGWLLWFFNGTHIKVSKALLNQTTNHPRALCVRR